MGRKRTDIHDSAIAVLIKEGADRTTAARIVRVLSNAGLSAPEIRAWLGHPTLAYPVTTGQMVVGGDVYPHRQTPIFAAEDGHSGAVLTAAENFARAPAYEREITLLYGGDVHDARRLTGGEEARARTAVRIGRLIEDRMGKRHHVRDVAQTRLPFYGGRRLVDLLRAGDEEQVLQDLVEDRWDPREALGSGELDLADW